MIKDQVTGEWRSWRPWEPSDAARIQETRPAPPFIPPRFVLPKGTAWERKSQHIFSVIRLTNNTEIYAFTSNTDPKQGDKVDLIWIDEDIEYPAFVAEWQARLSDMKGRLIWSAFPHSKNPALTAMSERALKDAEEGVNPPDVHETVVTFSDNPFIDPDEKRKRLKAWEDDPDEARARDLGQFLTDNILMFPSFHKSVHVTPAETVDLDDQIDTAIRSRGGQPPLEWTRYLVLDPGHVRPAVLFACVPPPELGRAIVVYDEIAGSRIDAYQLARRVYDKTQGQFFETFLIDSHAGRMTPMGYGDSVGSVYSKAFHDLHLRSRLTGSTFMPASDDVMGGIGMIRGLLPIQSNGKPILRIVRDHCPSLVRQLEHYRKKQVDKKVILDEPQPRQICDFVDCLRYLAAYSPTYTPPSDDRRKSGMAYHRFQERKKRRDQKKSQASADGVTLGPVS